MLNKTKLRVLPNSIIGALILAVASANVVAGQQDVAVRRTNVADQTAMLTAANIVPSTRMGAAFAPKLMSASAAASSSINSNSLPPFQLSVSGASELFLSNSDFHCETPVLPNEPLSAEPKVDKADGPMVTFRDKTGLIHMFSAGGFNFSFIGATIDTLTQDCSSVYLPHFNSDPTQYQYAEWLRSPYSIDGEHVYGVVHDEYHCDTANPNSKYDCSFESLTQVNSTNGGFLFKVEPMPQRLVATIPYKVIPPSTSGVGNNSNIIKNPNDGNYYMEVIEESNDVGPCMMRSSNLATWYAWNGTSFSVLMNNPAAYNNSLSTYSCAPIFTYPLIGINNIRFLSEYNLFVGLGSLTGSYYYVVSSDLVHWSAPVFLFPPNTLTDTGTWQPGETLPVGYGTLIDADSKTLNFDVIASGDSLAIYLVRTHTFINSQGVAQLDNSNRDILRYPLSLSGTAATRADAPTFSVAGGTYNKAQTVALSCGDSPNAIYYSTNGSTPEASTSLSVLYGKPLSVAKSETIKAICVAAGHAISPVSTAVYDIN
jgi:hypothetical protein